MNKVSSKIVAALLVLLPNSAFGCVGNSTPATPFGKVIYFIKPIDFFLPLVFVGALVATAWFLWNIIWSKIYGEKLLEHGWRSVIKSLLIGILSVLLWGLISIFSDTFCV